jgi:hypothetical protein
LIALLLCQTIGHWLFGIDPLYGIQMLFTIVGINSSKMLVLLCILHFAGITLHAVFKEITLAITIYMSEVTFQAQR